VSTDSTKSGDGKYKLDDLFNKQILKRAQENDTSLDKVRTFVVKEDNPDLMSYFFMRSVILYRVYNRNGLPPVDQIVVPKQYRSIILKLGHDIPLSGHMGNKKTSSGQEFLLILRIMANLVRSVR